MPLLSSSPLWPLWSGSSASAFLPRLRCFYLFDIAKLGVDVSRSLLCFSRTGRDVDVAALTIPRDLLVPFSDTKMPRRVPLFG